MFSVFVKLKTFTKHAFCQQSHQLSLESESYCCAATVSRVRPSRAAGGWKLMGKLNLFSEFSRSRCGNARIARENVSGIDRKGFRSRRNAAETTPASCSSFSRRRRRRTFARESTWSRKPCNSSTIRSARGSSPLFQVRSVTQWPAIDENALKQLTRSNRVECATADEDDGHYSFALHYDAGAYRTLQSVNLRPPAILRVSRSRSHWRPLGDQRQVSSPP